MSEPIIVFDDFSFRYKSQTTETLKHINLTIRKGEKVLLLGPSGSGKSTIGNCINGLIPFSYEGEITGTCTVAGINTKQSNIFALSKHVGTVQQDTDAQFIGLSVGEDIAFSLENEATPREEMISKVEEAARTVGMQDFLSEVPYDLSGGQKQKVALAGVLHNDEEILLFDEPLAALDPAMGMTTVDLIDRIYREQQKTVVIIEHRLEDVLYRHVDRIVLLAEGEIRLDTTPDELLRSGILKEMGIREPLYLSALKNAAVPLEGIGNLSDLSSLDPAKYREPLKKHFKEKEPTLTDVTVSDETILKVENVSFRYGEKDVLKDIDFTIHKGERISIIGRNGAGKSTMAKLLCGIIRPRTGSITFR
ncbi:MAG: DUF3744 domain-containing protein, partial [Lachnospiraceae bacterium]|nr:DUF3744 domain-containing protein [Lachnospiraceae bacterium]